MAASVNDYFKKLARRWVGQIGSGGVNDASVTTVPLSSATNLPTDTGVVVVIDRVDANGTTTSSKEETIVGVVSGSNLVNCLRGVEGTAQAHDAGAVVEVLFTNRTWGDLIDGLSVEHSQDGKHKAITTSQITVSNVTASQVTSSAITTQNLVASAITGTSKFPKVSGMHNNGSSGSAIAINWLNGDRQRVNITASTTMTFTNAADGQILTLLMYENGTGGYSITLPTMTWPASTVTTWTTSACAVNSFTALYDGTASKYCVQGTANYG